MLDKTNPVPAYQNSLPDGTEWLARCTFSRPASGLSTGTAQDVKEVTLTGEYKMVEGFLTRFEYRHDWSNQPFFDETTNPASRKYQDTLAVGFVAFFGPKR